MFPSTFDPQAHLTRRARLAEAMRGRPLVLSSSRARPRNYAAAQFPYRATSHFLYFFGVAHPDAYGLFDGERWTLYLPEPGPDDALWDGPVPTFAEIEAAVQCPVRGRGELPRALEGRHAATLPPPDLESCAALASLLGRPIHPGEFDEADEALAEAVISLRLCHDAWAVDELRRAADATLAAHLAGMRTTRPGVREAEVAAAMVREAMARDVAMAYQPIVTVHGEVLHSHRYHHALGAQDLLLADVGAESPGGFAADVTRTWPVSGRYSTTQRELYEVVLSAQEATIAAMRPGVRYRDLHLLAATEMAKGLVTLGILRGDPEELVRDGVAYLLFPHGVGHLLGLDVHDMEDLGDRAGYAKGRLRSSQFGLRYLRMDRDLEAGMAVTIEPGLYVVPAILEDPKLSALAGDRLDRARLAQFADVRGIRIEDDVLVTAGGAEILTAAIPKRVADVEAAMAAL